MGICGSTETSIEKTIKETGAGEEEKSSLPEKPIINNSAFLFIKPHANNSAVQQLVQLSLLGRGINILQEGEIHGDRIDREKLIDQHYYAIASKATLLKPQDMNVPAEKFEEFFGVSWQSVLEGNLVFNASDALTYLGITNEELFPVWSECKKVKFGGGFYCGEISIPEKPTVYVFNAFFLTLRSKFVAPNASIHYYIVEFSPNNMHWADFRANFLGPTDPANAPATSLRGKIMAGWEELGLAAIPNVGDNGVHASASPFEGLVEKMNWLKMYPSDDPFGARLIKAGISPETIVEWSRNPQVQGKSLFDQLEDIDASECIDLCQSLNKGVAKE